MPHPFLRALARSLVVALVSVACGRQETAPAAPAPAAAPITAAAPAKVDPAAARAAAEQLFALRCVTCHGAHGQGNGPASEGLTPPPRNFTDPQWQKSVTDAQIEQVIQYGGAAVGKSPAMPNNPDLMAKPEVVAELRAYVRSLAR